MPVETRGSKKRRLSNIESSGDDANISSRFQKPKKPRSTIDRSSNGTWSSSPLRRSTRIHLRHSSRIHWKVRHTDTNVEHPFVQCIYTLPDEILSIIFETSYTPDLDGFAFAKRISQVSRRFRSVAFSTHCLWATVSNVQAPNELKAFLERSGSTRKKILIFVKGYSVPQGKIEIDQLAAALIPYIDKWKMDDNHFEYRYELYDPLDNEFAKYRFKILFAIAVMLGSTLTFVRKLVN